MIKGEKCILRPLVYDDVEILNQWNHDEEINKYLGGGFHPVSIDLQKKWMESMIDTSVFSTSKRYMICVDEKPIGLVGLYSIHWIHRTAEIGIYIGEINNQGKGYATDAVSALTKYAKEYLNLRKLKLYVVEGNDKAISFWKKMKFVECGILYKERFIESEYKSLIIMERIINEKI